MTASAPPRRFLAPFIGIALVFAAFGPPIGGATFLPLALFLKAPAATGALALVALVGSLFGHWFLLLPAYLIGLGPATATGVLYAFWDAAAPPQWPRALVAAVLGGLVSWAVAQRLSSFGASFEMMVPPDFDVPSVQSISLTATTPTEPLPMGTGLVRAFVAAGGVAGLVCAMVASLLGLTMQPIPLRATPGGSA